VPQQNLLSTLHFRRQAQFQRDYEARVRASEKAEDRDAIRISSSTRNDAWGTGWEDASLSWAARAALMSSVDSPRGTLLAAEPSPYAHLRPRADSDDDAVTDVVMDVDG